MSAIPRIWQQSLCAVTGAIAGGFAGMVFGIIETQQIGWPVGQAVRMGVVFGLVGWIGILLIEALWLHYGAAVVWPSFVTSLLSAVLTVVVANTIAIPVVAVWIGLIIGTLVGALLCRLCDQRGAVTKGAAR